MKVKGVEGIVWEKDGREGESRVEREKGGKRRERETCFMALGDGRPALDTFKQKLNTHSFGQRRT